MTFLCDVIDVNVFMAGQELGNLYVNGRQLKCVFAVNWLKCAEIQTAGISFHLPNLFKDENYNISIMDISGLEI